MTTENSTISIGIPQLILCAVIAFVIYRYAAGSASQLALTSTPGVRPSQTARPVTADMIEAVQVMFPQVSASSIRWDLEKNGGSLEETTEKIINQGSLPEPPNATSRRATARPSGGRGQNATSAPSVSSVALGATPPQSHQSRSLYDDLITRYRLQDRLAQATNMGAVGNTSVKNDKASLLVRGRERRDTMILEARMKMEGVLSRQ